MRCRFETPMFVRGIPSGARNSRYIIGKRSGSFDLRELQPGEITKVGSVRRPAQVRPEITYHGARDGSGLFSDATALTGMTFAIDSSIPAIRSRIEMMRDEINRYGKGEIQKTWYPPSVADALLRSNVQGSRAMDEIDPSKDDIQDFDEEQFNRLHDDLMAELTGSYVTCQRRVYVSEPMPFLSVSIEDKAVSLKAQCADATAFLAFPRLDSKGCVRIFGIAEVDAAAQFASELATSESMRLEVLSHEVVLDHPEFFAFDNDAWQSRLLAEKLMSGFNVSVGRMGAVAVATQMPFEGLVLGRALKSALDDPQWMSRLDVMEAAISNVIDRGIGDGMRRYFVDPADRSTSFVLETWTDRVIDLGSSIVPTR